MIPNRMNNANTINPKKNRHTKRELPSMLYCLQGLAISARSWTTLSRNIIFPLELSQVKTTHIAKRNIAIKMIPMNQPGLSVSHSQPRWGRLRNSRKVRSSPLLLPELFPCGPSSSPAKKALNPMTNHLFKLNGLKSFLWLMDNIYVKELFWNFS